MAFIERIERSVLKTITYRVLILLSNFSVTYLLTRSLALATSVAGASFVINTIIYFLHERYWNSVRWGKRKQSK